MKQILIKVTHRRIPKKVLLFLTVLAALYAANKAVSFSFEVQLTKVSATLASTLKIEPSSLLKEVLAKGASFTSTIEYKVYKKAKDWYRLNEVVFESRERAKLRFDTTNQSYVAYKDKKIRPFFDFPMAWQFFQKQSIIIDTRGWEPGKYLFHIRAKGESIKLYFPIDWIYRRFLAKLDFSTDWQIIEKQVQ